MYSNAEQGTCQTHSSEPNLCGKFIMAQGKPMVCMQQEHTEFLSVYTHLFSVCIVIIYPGHPEILYPKMFVAMSSLAALQMAKGFPTNGELTMIFKWS